jgi:DNA-directed RNA polymerase specialized sigma24 family protein
MTTTSGPPVPRTAGAGPSDADEAFAVFYQSELLRQVRRAALLVEDPEVAHDLVHDAFVEVYRRWDALRDPGPYLGRAVLNGAATTVAGPPPGLESSLC